MAVLNKDSTDRQIRRALEDARLPSYMADGLELYLHHGITPGSFMTAMLKGDYQTALGCADDNNRAVFQRWMEFFHHNVVSSAHGSKEKVAAWCKRIREQEEVEVDDSDWPDSKLQNEGGGE
jgi:hypothetical protein